MVLKLGSASPTLGRTHREGPTSVRRVGGVGYGAHYIGRAGDYDKLWSAQSRFMASNCGEHERPGQTAATMLPRLFRLFYESRDYARGRGCRFDGRKPDDAVEKKRTDCVCAVPVCIMKCCTMRFRYRPFLRAYLERDCTAFFISTYIWVMHMKFSIFNSPYTNYRDLCNFRQN